VLTPGTNTENSKSLHGKAVAALIVGVTCIGAAPILVRLSEVGPSATAFYRVGIVLPIYWLLAKREAEAVRKGFDRRNLGILVGTGLFFAADLCLWHWALRYTSVANSTLLTNLAPVFVLMGARTVLHETTSRALLASVAMAMAGSAMLVASSVKLARENLFGDALSIVTAFFYAGYLVTLKRARQRLPTAVVMAISGLVSAPLMFLAGAAARENLLPETGKGWVVVLALGLISHLGGQGLIAYGLAHVQAAFSAAVLLWQPVVAAVLAAVVLGEPLSIMQIFGGVVVLLAIYMAQRSLPR
jgi:drug/metabolite transporter (DMT)-like permease